MWSFLQSKKNREVLGWIGAGLAVVIGGLWTAFVYFSKPGTKTAGSGPQASCGSVTAAGSVWGKIVASKTGDCQQRPKP
jgi:threonine/homoserine efflux transporter RhtA